MRDSRTDGNAQSRFGGPQRQLAFRASRIASNMMLAGGKIFLPEAPEPRRVAETEEGLVL
jgi:hypothetical protein